MHVVDVQRPEFGHVHVKKLHHLTPGYICHAVIGFVAVRHSVFEGGDQIGFGGFGLLDFQAGVFLAKRDGTKRILCIRHMSDNLAVAADGLSRLEVVILFGHFLGGADKDGFYPSVSELVERAERIRLCGLLPLLIGRMIGSLPSSMCDNDSWYY